MRRPSIIQCEERASSTRYIAVCMVNGGLTQVQVARQAAAEGWTKNRQKWDGTRPPRRDAGESQGQREEDGHESSGKNRRGEVCAETAPVNEETGVKTDCEVASRLQVGLTPLFAALPATGVAESAQTVQADSSTATQRQKGLDSARARLSWSSRTGGGSFSQRILCLSYATRRTAKTAASGLKPAQKCL